MGTSSRRSILDEVRAMGGEDDWVTLAQSEWARALIALGSGDEDSAVTHARSATEIADAREYINVRTYYWIGLGRVLVAAARWDEARQALAEARRLAETKGSPADHERIRALLEQLPVSD